MADEAETLTQNDVLKNIDALISGGTLETEATTTAKGGGDEPESGESEEESQDEAESEVDDEQETDETESEEKPRYKVKVDGQEVEVDLDEALAGYSREADYRRKTQEHAESVRQWEAQKEQALQADRAALAQEREQYKQVLGIWEAQISKALGDTEGLEQLRTENPGEWSARMTERYEWQQKLSNIKAEQDRLAVDERSKQAESQKQKFADEAKKMLEAIPEWKDQKVYVEDSNKIFAYANSLGFSREELTMAAANDHRIARIMKDAVAYRELLDKKPAAEKKVEAAKPLPPGPAKNVSQGSKVQKLRDDQAKRGDKKSTVALFEQLYT